MTPEQLATVKCLDRVQYDGRTGKVSQDAPTWFMVTWDDNGVPEIHRRVRTVFTDHLELVPS